VRRARRATATVAFAAALSWASASHADDEWSVSPTAPSDPLRTTSHGALGVGLGSTAVGAVLLATASGDEVCGHVAGCLQESNEGTQRDAAMLLLGGGLGMAVVGGAVAGAATWSPLSSGEEREGPGAAVAGLALLSLSGASLGAGLALGGFGRAEPQLERSAGLLIAGGLFAVAGVPLLVAGSSREDAQERAEQRAQEEIEDRQKQETRARRQRVRADRIREAEATEAKSPTMAWVGVGFMAVGTGIGAAFIVRSSNPTQTGWSGFSEKIESAAAAATSLVLGFGVGIPLVAVGTQRVLTRGAAPIDPPPSGASLSPRSVTVGPGSMSASWAF